MKKLVMGILAHVDAGKTTLSEGILYLSGVVRKLGRVDHRDAFLDTDAQERERGITIFSKQAECMLGRRPVTLLDTPGHVDFSSEMERTLQVLDYAVLVINGADGVQGHTETLWRLLKRYRIPVFLFVKKMDQAGTDRKQILYDLKKRLDGAIVDFEGFEALVSEKTKRLEWNGSGNAGNAAERLEELAMCSEVLLESYLETGTMEETEIQSAIEKRKVFPCYFGSALKLTGVEEFLKGVETFARAREYPKEFGAKVFKISRDDQGNRLTHLKITGGSLKVKSSLICGKNGETTEEKVNQIRIYSGAKFIPEEEVSAGSICAVAGLSKTFAGEGLGTEKNSFVPILEPVLSYHAFPPDNIDDRTALGYLKQLEEEEPQLHVIWNEQLKEIHVQLMGEIQLEILKTLIEEKFGVQMKFDEGKIAYKETISNAVEGVCHYEPLRHYA